MQLLEHKIVAISLGKAAVGAVISAVTSLAGIELTGNVVANGALAITIVSTAAIVGAFLSNIPTIIKAKSDAKKDEKSLLDAETNTLIQNIYAMQTAERESWQRERAAFQRRLEEHDATHALMVGTRHNLLSDLQNCILRNNELILLLHQNGIACPEQCKPDLAAAFRTEDDILAQRAKLKLNPPQSTTTTVTTTTTDDIPSNP